MIALGRVVSVQVGLPQPMETAQGRAWRSAIAKTPVSGAVTLSAENLDGDYQANRKYHGGPDKAVCVYPTAHYPAWQAEFSLEMPWGAFGENLSLDGLTEADLCIGDILTVGETRLQISQPRMPCINVARRWNVPRLPKRMEETGWTGFYCRVLQTGQLSVGDALTVAARPYPEWTVLRANIALYGGSATPDEIAALRDLPLLTGEWKRALGRKLRKLAGLKGE